MSSSKPIFRNALIALTLLGATGLAGCSSFTPVYGWNGVGTERLAFQYAEPKSRLDQIIYQELVLRFGRTTDPSSPTVRITTTSSNRKLTRSGVARPAEQREAVVTATIELIDAAGKVAMKTTRSASALYTSDGFQALAASEAEREAYERAARELAETVRLTLLGALNQTAT
jgi:hypothetical protein